MADLKKYDDEHMFFRLSMEAKAVKDGWSLAGMFNRLYYLICNYGWSIKRAAIWWSAVVFAPTPWLVKWVCDAHPNDMSFALAGKALALSLSNAIPFLGLKRLVHEKFYGQFEKIDGIHYVGMGQAILGTIFLFFLLLTIRNRFRLK